MRTRDLLSSTMTVAIAKVGGNGAGEGTGSCIVPCVDCYEAFAK